MLDVDGVLTDGRLIFGPEGEVQKRFHAHDGCAIMLWQRLGKKTAVLSSRTHPAVRARLGELAIDWSCLGEADKSSGYNRIRAMADCPNEAIAYVADDLPDVVCMARCGFAVAVSNAVPAVKRRADYITSRPGGDGAVAELVELILRKQKRWTRGDLAGSTG